MQFEYRLAEKPKRTTRVVLGPDGERRRKGRPKKQPKEKALFELPPDVLDPELWMSVRTWAKHNAHQVVNHWVRNQLVDSKDADRIAEAMQGVPDIHHKSRKFRYKKYDFSMSKPAGGVHNTTSKAAIDSQKRSTAAKLMRVREASTNDNIFQDLKAADKKGPTATAAGGADTELGDDGTRTDNADFKHTCANLISLYRSHRPTV